jgi:hypothetical protein
MDTIMNSSKNEIFIAIFLGILVGLTSVLTFYFIFKKKSMSSPQDQSFSVNLQKTVKTLISPIQQEFNLTVEPSDAELISQVADFKINGTTNKEAVVIVQTDETSEIIKPDRDGNFSFTTQLKNEINQIIFTAVYNNQEKTIEKTIYYEKKN